ncbi:MAG: PEP-CTERM sorting domain-containing protein [Akkermansia sp.]|nr:PEP-CTERM sorting domain-containing protein [Akkermansia sp.]
MKKTIITLLALSGLATAGTTATCAVGSANTDPIIATSELTLESLTAIITDQSLSSALLGLTVERNNGATKYPWSISANYWEGSNELHIYTKEAGQTVSGYANASFSDSSWPTGHKLSNSFTLEGAVKGAITLGYAGDHAPMTFAGTAVVFSVLYDDGSIVSIYGQNTAYKYSNDGIAYVTYDSDVLATPTITTGTDWTRESLIAANESALQIPEPTTATLSLLALAGLAARRRRK